MICATCKKQCHKQYWSKEKRCWECEKCSPYLKEEKKERDFKVLTKSKTGGK